MSLVQTDFPASQTHTGYREAFDESVFGGETDLFGAGEITIEQLIELDPEIILTSQDDTWPTPSKESILNDDALREVSAVKNDKVYDINADLVDRPGPRIVDGLESISGYITT